MADDPAGQAIGIIGALNEAGLLRTAQSTSQPTEQVIGALVRALAAPVDTVPEPPPPPEPKVGDEAFLGNIKRIEQFFGPLAAGVNYVTLTNFAPQGKGDYTLEFPPNDPGWLPGIDKIIAFPKKGMYVVASVKITAVRGSGDYVGKLTSLRAVFSLDPASY